MSHEVESMMYVGATPWHGLGTSFPKGSKLSVKEAIVAAALDWEVQLKEIYTRDRRGAILGIRDYYATCRKTDNAILARVSYLESAAMHNYL
jgi:hypothetical protein